MLKRLAIVFAAFVGLVAVVLAVLMVPTTFTAQRSRRVAAPVPSVLAQLDDLRAMARWLPRRQPRPNSSTFHGPVRGAGASWRWRNLDGELHDLSVVESSLDRVTYTSSAASNATQTVSLRSEGSSTTVTWTHSVTLRGWLKLVPLVRSVDSVVGPNLEASLAALEAALEAQQRAPPPAEGSDGGDPSPCAPDEQLVYDCELDGRVSAVDACASPAALRWMVFDRSSAKPALEVSFPLGPSSPCRLDFTASTRGVARWTLSCAKGADTFSAVTADLTEPAAVTFPWNGEAPRPQVCAEVRHSLHEFRCKVPTTLKQLEADATRCGD